MKIKKWPDFIAHYFRHQLTREGWSKEQDTKEIFWTCWCPGCFVQLKILLAKLKTCWLNFEADWSDGSLELRGAYKKRSTNWWSTFNGADWLSLTVVFFKDWLLIGYSGTLLKPSSKWTKKTSALSADMVWGHLSEFLSINCRLVRFSFFIFNTNTCKVILPMIQTSKRKECSVNEFAFNQFLELADLFQIWPLECRMVSFCSWG